MMKVKKRSTPQQPLRRSERLRMTRMTIQEEDAGVQVNEGEHSNNIGCWPHKSRRPLSYCYSSSEEKWSSCSGSYSVHSWDAKREARKACDTLELLRGDGLIDEKLFDFAYLRIRLGRFAQAVNMWRSHEELESFLRGEFEDYEANNDRSFMRWM